MLKVGAFIIDFDDDRTRTAQVAGDLQCLIISIVNAQPRPAQVLYAAAQECLLLADLCAQRHQIGTGQNADDACQPPSPSTGHNAQGHGEDHGDS